MFTAYIPFVFNTTSKDILSSAINEFIPDAIIQDIDLVSRIKKRTGLADIPYFIAFVKFTHIGDTIKHIISAGRQIDVPIHSSTTKQTVIHLTKYVPKPNDTTTTTPTYAQVLSSTTSTTTTPTITTTTTPTTTTDNTPIIIPFVPIETRIAQLELSLAHLSNITQHLLIHLQHLELQHFHFQQSIHEHLFLDFLEEIEDKKEAEAAAGSQDQDTENTE